MGRFSQFVDYWLGSVGRRLEYTKGDSNPMTLAQALALIEVLVPLFIKNGVVDAEIIAWINAVILLIGKTGSGSLPPFDLGNQVITISYAPKG